MNYVILNKYLSPISRINLSTPVNDTKRPFHVIYKIYFKETAIICQKIALKRSIHSVNKYLKTLGDVTVLT